MQSGIRFENYDLLSDRHIAAAVDELVDQYTGACSCPLWLAELIKRAVEIRGHE